MERDPALESNIWKLQLLRGLHMGMLVMPILVIFWLSLGLSLTQVFVLQAWYAATVLLFEIPSGYIADVLGRKGTLVTGYSLLACGFGVYCVSRHFTGFLVGEIFLGVGMSLISGIDSAILFDTLKCMGREGEFVRQMGRLVFWGQASEAFAAIAGGALAMISTRLPFYLYTLQLLVTAAAAMTLKEPPHEMFRAGRSHWANIRQIGGHLALNPDLRAHVLFCALIGASSSIAVWLYQPYWRSLGIPIAWFGVLWAGINLTVAFSAELAHRFRDWVGRRRALAAIAFMPGLGFLGMGAWTAPLAALCGLSVQCARGLNSALLTDEITRRTSDEMRVTVNSIVSGVLRIIFILLAPCLGASADRWGLQVAFLACAAVFFIGGVGSLQLVRCTERNTPGPLATVP